MSNAGRVIWRWFFTANPKWICGIKVEDFTLGYIDLRNPVVGSGQEKVMIKSNFARPRFQLTIPVWTLSFFTKSEVPFTHYGGLIPSFLHKIGESESASVNN